MSVQLRPYQQKAVDDLRAAFASGKRAPLLVMPTGSGKTYTYSAIAEGAEKRGSRVLILEHRKELLRQASCSLAALGVAHQVVAPADKVADIRRVHVARYSTPMVDRNSHVAVASVQTLIRRLDWLKDFNPNLIVVDEGDLAIAGSWKTIISAVPEARLLGVTASPCRTDGAGMNQVYDCLVLGPSMASLIEMGALCRPRVFAPPLAVDLSTAAHKGGDFDPNALAELLDKPSVTGDAVDHYRRLAPCRPAIVFCASVRHAEHVSADFRAAGFRFEVVTGDMPDDDRDDRIFGLASGKYHGIVTVDVVSRGTDIPVAEVAILLRPTESLALYLQQVGRVLRPAAGKEFGLVLDHAGNVARHSLPHAERDWSLEGRKKGKRAANDNEPSLRIMQCPKCYLTHESADKCPNCGHAYEMQGRIVDQREGELQEITVATAPIKVQTGRLQTIQQMKAAGLSDARAQHILAARAEKQRLQNELKELLARWSSCGNKSIFRRWGFTMADIHGMKPKILRENISKVSEALFMGEAANDNKSKSVFLSA